MKRGIRKAIIDYYFDEEPKLTYTDIMTDLTQQSSKLKKGIAKTPKIIGSFLKNNYSLEILDASFSEYGFNFKVDYNGKVFCLVIDIPEDTTEKVSSYSCIKDNGETKWGTKYFESLGEFIDLLVTDMGSIFDRPLKAGYKNAPSEEEDE